MLVSSFDCPHPSPQLLLLTLPPSPVDTERPESALLLRRTDLILVSGIGDDLLDP